MIPNRVFSLMNSVNLVYMGVPRTQVQGFNTTVDGVNGETMRKKVPDGGGEGIRTGTFDVTDQSADAKESPGDLASGRRISFAVDGGGDDPLHQPELQPGGSSSPPLRALAEHGSVGLGGGLLRGGAAGRVGQTGGAVAPCHQVGETLLRGPGLPLLRSGGRNREYPRPLGQRTSALTRP